MIRMIKIKEARYKEDLLSFIRAASAKTIELHIRKIESLVRYIDRAHAKGVGIPQLKLKTPPYQEGPLS